VTTVVDRPETTPPAVRKEPVRWGGAIWTVPPLLIVLVCAVYPVARVLAQSTDGEGGSSWSGVLGSSLFRKALWRTAEIAVLSTLGCLVLGTFVAIVLAFVPFPGSQLVGRLIDTVLALPSFLITLSFTFL
jgi:2-aminoethylphosphonate transport system permease protein